MKKAFDGFCVMDIVMESIMIVRHHWILFGNVRQMFTIKLQENEKLAVLASEQKSSMVTK